MYGYYKNKEALFNDIVEEVSEEFKNDYLVEELILRRLITFIKILKFLN
ncbi:MAG: hypothetical protein ACLRQF_05285 [Thomasclavelia ramosa]